MLTILVINSERWVRENYPDHQSCQLLRQQENQNSAHGLRPPGDQACSG